MITSTTTKSAAIGSTIAPIARSIAAVQERRKTNRGTPTSASMMLSAIAIRSRELVGVFLERRPRFVAELRFPALVVVGGDELRLKARLVDLVEDHPEAPQLVAHRLVQVDVVVARLLRRHGH